MKKIFTTAVTLAGWLAAFMLPADAALSVTQRTDIRPAKFKSARIIFNGDITAKKSLEFIDALDKLHYASPGLKEITLYINSYGGDMDSGYLLYQAIKNAAIPITAVNISMTASSATMMYCAAKKRLAMPLATFLLHPAAVENLNRQYIKPDELASLKQLSNKGNVIFEQIYRQCTNLNDDEIASLLASESTRLLLNAGQAIERKMAEGISEGLAQADISVIVTDDKA